MSPVERRIPHFVFASVLTSYPFAEEWALLPALISVGLPDLPKSVREAVDPVARDPEEILSLESEYIDLFERGRTRNPLYETEYGRDRAMAKGSELADVAGFYRAFGFEGAEKEEFREMVDHVAVELEFYALLLMKQDHLEEAGDAEGVAVVRDARGKFMLDHLGRFVDALAERPGVVDSFFYGRVLEWCRDLINEECRTLGVSPMKTTWTASTPPKTECGGEACGN